MGWLVSRQLTTKGTKTAKISTNDFVPEFVCEICLEGLGALWTLWVAGDCGNCLTTPSLGQDKLVGTWNRSVHWKTSLGRGHSLYEKGMARKVL